MTQPQPQNIARHSRMSELLTEHRTASLNARSYMDRTDCEHDSVCDCEIVPDAPAAQVWATLALAAATALSALAQLDATDHA